MPTADFEQKVRDTLQAIDESNRIHQENKELIHDFERDLRLEGLSDAWLQKLTAHLKIIGEHIGDTRFKDMDKEDIKDLVAWVQKRDISEATQSAYKQVIKRFWRWLYDNPKGEHPEITDWVNTGTRTGRDKLPSELLTKEEVEKQIKACKNPRDKAFIAILYETGARIGELIDITVGDIEDRKHGKKITIDGKTGSRRLPLVESVPHLNKWLNNHPNPEKHAYLWCKIQQGGPDDQLGYRYIREKILKKTMERAEIDKPSNPHHYRHSRASYLANEMTEAQLCEWFGWVQGSDVPARYVHLSGRDIDNAYDEMHGIVDPDEDEKEPQVTECPRCEELNEHGAQFCMRCGFALDIDAAEEVETAEGNMEKDLGGVDTEDVLEALLESYDGDTEQLLSRVK